MSNLYDIVVTPLNKRFLALDKILTKLAEHCVTNNMKEEAFLNDRLFPDMFPLASQVRIATDMTKGAVGRLTSVDVPKFEDNETTVEELRARVQRLIAFLGALKAEDFQDSESKQVVMKRPNGEVLFEDNGWNYVMDAVLPNVYFHLTTTYAILRHRGLSLGKMDFLGRA